MKSKFFLFFVWNLIAIFLLLAQNKALGNDLLISIQNEKIIQLSKDVTALKEQIAETKNTNASSMEKFLPIFVSGIAFIASLVLTVFTFLNNTVNKQYKESLENIENRVKKNGEEIRGESKKIKASSKDIKQLNKELSAHHTYLKESVELLFELQIYFANATKDKNWLKAIFVKRAISSLYSIDENERFSGISTLGESGGSTEIKHLENVIKNKEESDNNRILAADAVAKIRLRTQN